MNYKFIKKEFAFCLINNSEHIKYYSINEFYRTPKDNDVLSFNHVEKAVILDLCHSLESYNILIDKNIKIIHFMKMKNNMDWNYPYTFIYDKYNIIVLTGKYINDNFNNEFNKTKSIRTIYHEIIHLEQKRNLLYYDNINITTLGFKKIRIEDFDNIRPFMITNPDGFYKDNNNIYVYNINGKLYFSFLNTSLEEKIINIKYINNKFYLGDKITNYTKDILTKFKLYDNTYLNNQLYHPNEIYANLKSNFIIKKNII